MKDVIAWLTKEIQEENIEYKKQGRRIPSQVKLESQVIVKRYILNCDIAKTIGAEFRWFTLCLNLSVCDTDIQWRTSLSCLWIPKDYCSVL